MPMISYAQNGEDVLLNRVFRGKSRGFYIDVGAHDAVWCSVTKHFYDQGWTGINIEPSPDLHRRLARARPRDINLNLALSDRPGQMTFYEGSGRTVGLSTCDADTAAMHRRAGLKLEERAVPVVSLREIARDHVGDRRVDFLSIDVEGHERAVIDGCDWTTLRPVVLVIEATVPNSPEPAHEAWEPLVLQAGYTFAAFDGLNRYYVRHENPDLIKRLEAPANIFDDYVRYEHWQEIRTLKAKTRGLHRIGAHFHRLARRVREAKSTSLSPPACVARVVLGDRSLRIADVGARWGAEDAWFRIDPLTDIVGFEPDRDECARLNAALDGRTGLRYVPVALGRETGPATLHLTKEPACASIYPPNAELAKRLPSLWKDIEPVGAKEIALMSLEDWATRDEVETLDMMKLDVQGAELDVLKGAGRLLDACLVLDVEVEFMPIYEDQPLFADVDGYLRQAGFTLWRINQLVHYAGEADPLSRRDVSVYDGTRSEFRAGTGRLGWGHALYIREPHTLPSDEPDGVRRLLKLAVLLDAASEREAFRLCVARLSGVPHGLLATQHQVALREHSQRAAVDPQRRI